MNPLTNYLSEGKKILNFLFERNNSIVCMIDSQGKILHANTRFLETIGLSLDETRERNIVDFFTEKNSEKLREAIEKMKKGKEIEDLKIKVEKSNGKVKTYEVNAIPLGLEQNNTAFLLNAKEITYREKFQISLNKFKTLFMKSPIGIELFDSDGKNLIVNEACLNIFGVTDPSSIKHIDLFSSPFIPEEAKVKVKNGETVQIEVPYSFNKVKKLERYETKKEDYIYLDVLIAPITLGEDKEIINYLVYIQDITDRKRMEQKIKESLNRSKFYQDLLAHDIGNILNNIKSSLQLIKMWKDKPRKSDKEENVLRIMEQQIERGSSLIGNMRNISKIEEEKQAVSPIEIKSILKEAIDIIYSRFPEKGLKILTDFPEGKIKANGGSFLLEAFENILQNAIIHNGKDLIKIWCEVSKISQEGEHYVKIEFKDNGIGISDERKEIIFYRSYKRDKSRGGMGIGLSLVKKIINEYGGKVWVEDRVEGEYEKGSNFIILLRKAN